MSTHGGSGHGSEGSTGHILRVREALPVEYETVGWLTVAAFRGVADSTLSDGYAAELGDVASRAGDALLLVAEVDGEVVGSVAYVPDSHSPLAEWLGPGEAGIRMLAVAPQAQGAGAGAALVEACVERATAGGRSALALYSTEAMHSAHRLYLRAGFVRAVERDHEVAPDFRLLCFVKPLG